jgi:hypothetical protein
MLLLSLPIAGLFWMSVRPHRSNWRARRILATMLLALFSISCGGGLQGNGTVNGGIGNPGTPLGGYNITVTANTGAVTHSAQVILTVQ